MPFRLQITTPEFQGFESALVLRSSPTAASLRELKNIPQFVSVCSSPSWFSKITHRPMHKELN